MPTSQQFKEALEKVHQRTDSQMAFLQAHYSTKARALTATHLSKSADYKNYRPINLLYGKLAADLARELGTRGGLSLLCDFFRPGTLTNREWILVMKPDFAEGLRLAGWVKAKQDA
ncbi:hypothetical protein [Terriglobus aquaticus]|uniref:Uncharacterized protein n=1 Tax=Terriglobus aquaticus TaxID=940139 RepID=A0ABW9KPZ3_9BACT|nr:hypothetical protein [Terriglobus aquaticus]